MEIQKSVFLLDALPREYHISKLLPVLMKSGIIEDLCCYYLGAKYRVKQKCRHQTAVTVESQIRTARASWQCMY